MMSSDNTFSRDIRKTADNPEEDYAVKRLFANKPFLSWIRMSSTGIHMRKYLKVLVMTGLTSAKRHGTDLRAPEQNGLLWKSAYFFSKRYCVLP